MSRLIDADTLMDWIWRSEADTREKIGKIISDQPTVDAIHVVRCKDCKWWDKKDNNSTYGYCDACKHGHISEHWEIGIYRTYKSDWFCAYGEAKE